MNRLAPSKSAPAASSQTDGVPPSPVLTLDALASLVRQLQAETVPEPPSHLPSRPQQVRFGLD
jgi:hypothetical protein